MTDFIYSVLKVRVLTKFGIPLAPPNVSQIFTYCSLVDYSFPVYFY